MSETELNCILLTVLLRVFMNVSKLKECLYETVLLLFRFTIYKVHKASKKKREKSSAKKERKATKTLAIVLGELWSSVYNSCYQGGLLSHDVMLCIIIWLCIEQLGRYMRRVRQGYCMVRELKHPEFSFCKYVSGWGTCKRRNTSNLYT